MNKTITINYSDYINLDRELKDLRLRIKSYEKQIPILIIRENWHYDNNTITKSFENIEKASKELKDIYFNFEKLELELKELKKLKSENNNLIKELKSENNNLRKELLKPWYKRMFNK